MSTFVWLGTMRVPGMLVEFWRLVLVRRLAGAPTMMQVKAPVRCREGPITVPEATPIATPALSPLVIGMVVARLCAGAPRIRHLTWLGIAVGPMAMFGYGMGIGPAGDGVRQTSGTPRSWPIIC